jgi:hypothetical protein
LLLFTRQMDMLMHSEYSVDAVVKNFRAGNYRYDQNLVDALQRGLPAGNAAEPGSGKPG